MITNAGDAATTIDQGWDLRGLSSDANPPETWDCPNGTSLFEMDTFKVYFWDKNGKQWITKGGEVR